MKYFEKCAVNLPHLPNLSSIVSKRNMTTAVKQVGMRSPKVNGLGNVGMNQSGNLEKIASRYYSQQQASADQYLLQGATAATAGKFMKSKGLMGIGAGLGLVAAQKYTKVKRPVYPFMEKKALTEREKRDLRHVGAGAGASMTTAILVNPLENIANARTTNDNWKAFKSDLALKSTAGKVKHLFTRGLEAKLPKVGLAGGLTFGLYNKYKDSLRDQGPVKRKIRKS